MYSPFSCHYLSTEKNHVMGVICHSNPPQLLLSNNPFTSSTYFSTQTRNATLFQLSKEISGKILDSNRKTRNKE